MSGTPPTDATLRALLLADRDAATTARWVAGHRSLVPALLDLARRSRDPALYQSVVEACGMVLAAFGPDGDPRQRAWVQAERANALRWLGGAHGVDEALLEQAIAGFDAALSILTPEVDPQAHALTLARRSAAVSTLGGKRQDEAMLRQALAGFDAALAEPTLAALAYDHGTAHLNRANGLGRLFDVSRDPRWLRPAAEGYAQAYDAARFPDAWSDAQQWRVEKLLQLGVSTRDAAALAEAGAAAEAALTVFTAEGHPEKHAATVRLRDRAQTAGTAPVQAAGGTAPGPAEPDLAGLIQAFLAAPLEEKRRLPEQEGAAALLQPGAEEILRAVAAQATTAGDTEAAGFFEAHADLLRACRAAFAAMAGTSSGDGVPSVVRPLLTELGALQNDPRAEHDAVALRSLLRLHRGLVQPGPVALSTGIPIAHGIRSRARGGHQHGVTM